MRARCIPRGALLHNVRMTDPSAPRPPSVLTIAGSDSGGGAGIQADLKTFAAHGVHGLSAIAALTAQHTRGVTAVHAPPVAFLRAQIDACFDDFDVRAVKIGMLATAEIVDAVADALALYPDVPVVLDPVMIATSGAKLLDDDALGALRSRLIPRARVLTPNLPEAELLLGRRIAAGADAEAALAALRALGAHGVLLKGGHLDEGDEVVDRYADAGAAFAHRAPRLDIDGHGTGCTLSSAIAARLALGEDAATACRAGIDYVHRAMRDAYRPGRSAVSVLGHLGPLAS